MIEILFQLIEIDNLVALPNFQETELLFVLHSLVTRRLFC